jgi:hypothetical protein
MKTRNKNIKLRKTKTNSRTKTKTRKMKGGAFLTNLWNGFLTPKNKGLNEDLNKLSTHKETIRKTLQSMYDTAKNADEFNKNYALFTTSVTDIGKLVIDINKHRSNPANMTNSKPVNPTPANPNPTNRKLANQNPANQNPVNPTPANPNRINTTDVIAGVGAAAGAGLAIKELANEI